jgi:hypothetical protein
MTGREEDLCRRLGLMGATLGDVQSVPWGQDDANQAMGVAEIVVASALFAPAPPPTTEVDVPGLREFGVRLRTFRQEPRILNLSAERVDQRLHVEAPEAGGEAVATDPEYPDIVGVDTRTSGPFVLELEGRRIVINPTNQGLDVYPVVASLVLKRSGPSPCLWDRSEVYPLVASLALEPLAPIPAPEFEMWLADCRDSWLAGELEALVSAGDDWSLAVASGAFVRLMEPAAVGQGLVVRRLDPGGWPPSTRAPSATAASQRVEALLRGEVDETLARPRRWIRGLTPEQIRTVEQLALAEADRLMEALDEVVEATESATTDWSSEWVALCQSREDLEGVRVLLTEVGRHEALGRALATLDREGRRTSLGIPLARVPADEKLSRAHRIDPDAWWGRALKD